MSYVPEEFGTRTFRETIIHAVDVDEWTWPMIRWETIHSLAHRDGWSLSRACRRLGIGRATAYRWRELARADRANLERIRSVKV